MNPESERRPSLTRARKLVFALLTVGLVLFVVEGGARAYSALRFRNTEAVTYGTRFLAALLQGEVTTPVADNRPVVSDARTEEIFAKRGNSDLAIALRPPMDVMLDGHPAHFNSLGLRGRDVDLSDSRRRRIAVLGGSDVFGAFIEDRETWPSVLDERLRAEGFAVDVLNGAANGHNIDAVLHTAIAIAQTVKVDYLLVTSAYNNRHMLPMQRRFTLARRADWYLYNLSMFHVMLKEKLALLQRQPIDYGLYRQKIRVDAAAVSAWLALYERRLQQIATVAAERQATLVLSTQGELFQEARLNASSTLDEAAVGGIGERINRGEEIWLSELEFFMQGTQNLAVKRFARTSSGVLFFDGAAVLQDDKASLFLDPIHPGPLGARKLAEALVVFFRPLLQAARGEASTIIGRPFDPPRAAVCTFAHPAESRIRLAFAPERWGVAKR